MSDDKNTPGNGAPGNGTPAVPAPDPTTSSPPLEIMFDDGLVLDTVGSSKLLPHDKPGDSPIAKLQHLIARVKHGLLVGLKTAQVDAVRLRDAAFNLHGRLCAVEEVLIALADEGKLPVSPTARRAIAKLRSIRAKREADERERDLADQVQAASAGGGPVGGEGGAPS